MGGCYERSYSYSEPTRARASETDPMTLFKRRFNKFLTSKDRKDLLSSYHALLSHGKEKGFMKNVHDVLGIKGIPKEFPEYEIEAKFEIELIPRSQSEEPSLEEIMDVLDIPPTSGAQFLKDPVNAISTGHNHFYGTSNGEERLVLIEKGKGLYKKEKGKITPYSFGIPLEDYILKRHETRVPATVQEVIEIFDKLSKKDRLVYQGSIEKTKADFFLINVLSGREYGMTVSDSRRLPDKEERQLQFEMEYAGYSPKFPSINIGDEREIVNEMSILYRTLLMHYGISPVSVNNSYDLRLNPTKETKFEFVSSNKKPREVNGSSLELLASIPSLKRLAR